MVLKDADRYRAPALDKGLDIIELLAGTEASLSQAEISKALGRTPNEIYRMLDRLVRRDYVLRTSEDRYELTLKLFELAHSRPPINRLVRQATPVMRHFARESEQACHLVIEDRNALIVVAQVDGPGYWNISLRVGARMALVNTGSGHVFLAHAAPDERLQMIEAHGLNASKTLTHSLAARLDKVREQGYENMPSVQVGSVYNLSVPVFGPLGSVIAVLTCPYTERLDRKDAPDTERTIRLLRAAAAELSQRSNAAGQ
ncbi:IclR family transcriptional regulator [Pelagibacterium limicola]|uniref:IclR family transcriptional regulator n=1 Tax=Pelagibacterium limicola TaxID=2791022 RepID=UPI0018AF6241|nr:IclR family transcriptional regulator [Pelagibacterium limicola]